MHHISATSNFLLVFNWMAYDENCGNCRGIPFSLIYNMLVFCRTRCSTLNQSALALENNTLQGTCKLSTNQRLAIYAGATGLAIITNFARTIMFYFLCVNASRVLHNRMFASVLRAPILFFDTNPIGETTVVTTGCVHC